MRRVLDKLEKKLQEISSSLGKILDEDFMMGIFSEYLNELPGFKQYWDMMFKTKQMSVNAHKSGTKIVHFARLPEMLFFIHTQRLPHSNTNHQSHSWLPLEGCQEFVGVCINGCLVVHTPRLPHSNPNHRNRSWLPLDSTQELARVRLCPP